MIGLHRNHVVDLLTPEGPMSGKTAGKLLKGPTSAIAMPAVGDWVAADSDGTVHQILERRTTLSRRSPADRDRVQVMAANVDVVIVVSSLNKDHDIDRLERMVALGVASGARTIVALSKSDLVDDPTPVVDEAAERFPHSKVLAFSSKSGENLDEIKGFLKKTETVVLLGSSGVGKSTLANTLLGHDRQKTSEIRGSDDRGRHATTSRELFTLPGGALMIDTPGLRAPGRAAEETVDERQTEIDRLSEFCKFRDCGHETEPGCAVTAAVEAGELRAR